MVVGEESTTTDKLNQHNPKRRYNHLFLRPQVSVVLTPHQGNFYFKQKDIYILNSNQSKFRDINPGLSGYIYKIYPQLKLRQK